MEHKIVVQARGAIVEALEDENPGSLYWVGVQRTSVIVHRYGSADTWKAEDDALIESEVRERFGRLINGRRQAAREIMRHARAAAIMFARNDQLAKSIDAHFTELAKLLEDDTITIVWRDQ